MPSCVLKFWTKILNKISKKVYFFIRLKDKDVCNYKINSFNLIKSILQEFESHNESCCDYFSVLRLQVDNQVFKLNSLFRDFFLHTWLFKKKIVHRYRRSTEPTSKEEYGQSEERNHR